MKCAALGIQTLRHSGGTARLWGFAAFDRSTAGHHVCGSHHISAMWGNHVNPKGLGCGWHLLHSSAATLRLCFICCISVGVGALISAMQPVWAAIQPFCRFWVVTSDWRWRTWCCLLLASNISKNNGAKVFVQRFVCVKVRVLLLVTWYADECGCMHLQVEALASTQLQVWWKRVVQVDRLRPTPCFSCLIA